MGREQTTTTHQNENATTEPPRDQERATTKQAKQTNANERQNNLHFLQFIYDFIRA